MLSSRAEQDNAGREQKQHFRPNLCKRPLRGHPISLQGVLTDSPVSNRQVGVDSPVSSRLILLAIAQWIILRGWGQGFVVTGEASVLHEPAEGSLITYRFSNG